MRKSVVLTAVLLAAGCLAASAGPATAGVTKEQLDKAIAKLCANAEIWAQDKNIPTNDLADLSSLKFDKESAPVITAALGGIKRDTEGLYATARLLEHLQGSDLETIRAVIPEVQRIELLAKGLYRSFPPKDKAKEESPVMPKWDPHMSTENIMARMGSLDSMRDGRKLRDVAVAKQNEAAWDTEQAAYKLLAVGGDQSDDGKAMAAMAVAERAGDGIFITILDAYQAATAKMEPARAAKLYQVLRPHALRLRMQGRKKYILKGKSQLHADTTSEMSSIEESAGSKVLALINTLVDAAKDKSLAKVPVPTQKEIDEFNKKKK
jgi:hypothetical protein